MLPTATIVFREFLEIALVLTIVMAATRGLKSRSVLVVCGFLIGMLGAFIIALFTKSIAAMVDGVGQEIFNAMIMFLATGFLSWTVIWMKQHGRELAMSFRQVGQDVLQGNKPLYVIVTVVALATFREGAETVLFAYGMIVSKQFTLGSIILGALLGAFGGAAIGVMLYFGLLKAAQRHLFTVTSWMLIVLTAGMAAHGAAFLVAADVLPAIIPQLWDTSNVIAGQSILGQVLGVLVGYTPRPSAIELLFYVAVIVGLAFLYHRVELQQRLAAKKS